MLSLLAMCFFPLCKMCFARKILLLSSELDEGKNGIV